MVRLRTIGVAKSPPLIEIAPLLRSAVGDTSTGTGGGVSRFAAGSSDKSVSSGLAT